ncbi:LysM peptidoglycan-binding domain-containing protein [Gorillibacterium sp. CAU 1737]|uniref:LysM peptidoglycan-binding domain-containing protein n=1 Tax=Gorillibacterium sp. CAU 1737 TaxID=3140362 RepID=UPI003260A359
MSVMYYCEPVESMKTVRRNDGSGQAGNRRGMGSSRFKNTRQTGSTHTADKPQAFVSRAFILGLLIVFSLFSGFLVTAYATADNAAAGRHMGTGAFYQQGQPAQEPSLEEKALGRRIIDVAPGETLWAIANKYSEGRSIRSYLQEIKDVNGLTSTQLQIGQLLILPDSK